MQEAKNKIVKALKWSEKYTKTDMVYLAKGGFWLNANTVITSVFAFALSIAFAKLVPKEIYGTYQFVISISSIIGAFTLTGMNTAITQAVARGFEGTFKKSVKIQIKYGLIPLILGFIGYLYYLLNQNSFLSISIIIVAIILPLTNALNIWTAFLSGRKDFKHFFIYNQIINLFYYSGMIGVIFIFPNALLLVLTNFVLGLIANLIVYKSINKRYPPNNQYEEKATEYGKKLSLSNILPMIILNIDNIIIFHLLGPASLAVYTFASNIPDRFISLIRPVSSLALPKFSEKSVEEIKLLLPQKIFRLILLSILFGLFYILIAPFIYKIIFSQYLESIFYSQIYIVAVMISTLGSMSITALFATRSSKIYLFNIINPIFNITTIIVGAYTFGIWGVIFGRIIGNTSSLLLSYHFVKTSSSPE